MKVFHRQAKNGPKQARFQLGYHVLQFVFAKIGEVHECGDARREFDQLFLYELALVLVFLLFRAKLRFLFVFRLVLQFLDLLALVDCGLDDVAAQRPPTLDTSTAAIASSYLSAWRLGLLEAVFFENS